ncbi:MAG: hypothetical protein ACHQ6U_12200 [Thermodesulfobacteriota bacterium]
MNASRNIFRVLALSFIVAFPYKASTKEIPFKVTYGEPVGEAIELGCSGPALRVGGALLKPYTVARTFYSAKETIFSPYG